MTDERIFLLSPANCGGKRARLLLRTQSQFDLAVRLRESGAPLSEVFQFISGLYFRGKLAYAEAFARPPAGCPPALVIAPGRGLLPPGTIVSLREVQEMASIPVDADEPRYRQALERDARQAACRSVPVVLLGSVASAKYTDPLLHIFGDRLLFPADFVGRGDMSRGGLMLRCARERRELSYIPVRGAVLRGPRPPRLPKLGK
ncbi:MAG: hypothetical protein SFV54_07835 [Bryobacteraceae bacterium]|nr:hypothetical protein [Bryobacteraceae bacterium]